MKKRPRTIFAPFALVAAIALGVALVRCDGPIYVAPPMEAQLTKGAKHAQVAEQPTPQQRLRARLMIPVVGVTRRDLRDTWDEARAEGRSHQGIDIMAPQGTRVQAVADGRIVKFFNSERGGVTVYQFDQSERFVFYYAHLGARAAGLMEGDHVRPGATIGYVGMTGNAPVPHLHFEIQRLTPAKRWWDAEAMNPYPALMTGAPPA